MQTQVRDDLGDDQYDKHHDGAAQPLGQGGPDYDGHVQYDNATIGPVHELPGSDPTIFSASNKVPEERKEMARRDRGDGYPERRVPGVKNRRTKEIIPCRSGTDGIAEYRRHCGQVPETEQAVVDEKERYQEAFCT